MANKGQANKGAAKGKAGGMSASPPATAAATKPTGGKPKAPARGGAKKK